MRLKEVKNSAYKRSDKAASSQNGHLNFLSSALELQE
jgi:hypothetical protein